MANKIKKRKMGYKFEVLEYGMRHNVTSLDSSSNYVGDDYDGFLTLSSCYPHDLISEFNYEYFQNWLTNEKIDFEIVYFGHWLVGDYSRIGIPITNSLENLVKVDNLLSELIDYPIFDDCEYSTYEFQKYQEFFGADYGGFYEVKEVFYEFVNLPMNDCDYSDEVILSTWTDFVEQCHWEYQVEQSSFLLNLNDYIEFLHLKFSYLHDKNFSELYFARNNPDQLSLF